MGSLLLLGDIVVDVTLKSEYSPYRLRLGGIIHAARGAWSLNRDYHVAYSAPEYLEPGIQSFLQNLNCQSNQKLGNVIGAPYVFLIQDVKESGEQGYEFLLRDEIKIEYNTLTTIRGIDDALLISGNYDVSKALEVIDSDVRLHIDAANNVQDFTYFEKLPRKSFTIFISTSSSIFRTFFNGNFLEFANLFKPFTKRLVLKENRGGSRGIDFDSGEMVNISSQTQPITHSVGIGDVYNTCYTNFYRSLTFTEALNLASWVASEYAATTFPDDFKNEVQRLLKIDSRELLDIKGVTLPWEARKEINVYIAGPDFDFVDPKFIDQVEVSLKYHNFSPHRPIKENGQMESNANSFRKKELFNKDMALLEACKIVVAVLLYNDPGTLVEIGLAEGLGIPVIVYDPLSIAKNCMLTELPRLVSNDLDKIICEVFIQSSKLL